MVGRSWQRRSGAVTTDAASGFCATAQEARTLLETVGASTPLLVEEWIPIDREVASIVARRPNGEMAVFPLVETVQVDGICHELRAPAGESDEIVQAARAIAHTIAEAIQLEGLMAVELFVSRGGLIVNELAAQAAQLGPLHHRGKSNVAVCATHPSGPRPPTGRYGPHRPGGGNGERAWRARTGRSAFQIGGHTWSSRVHSTSVR